jgi:hypothetical protein
MDGTRFFLRPDVFACVTPNSTVFLNLTTDEYLALSREQTRALSAVVPGWPANTDTDTQSEDVPREKVLGLANKLAHIGLLTKDATTGKALRPAHVEIPRDYPLVALGDRAPAIHLRHFVNIINAWASAALSLRLRKLERVVGSVSHRNEQIKHSSTHASAETVQSLAQVFMKLRLLIYSPKDQCLLDSLVMVNFLARHDIACTWVLGVKPTPFEAHSWVQYGPFVLNDTAASVRRFTPIMSI